MSPKPGTSVTLVAPPDPIAAVVAASAAAGQIESLSRSAATTTSSTLSRTTLAAASSAGAAAAGPAAAPAPAHEPDPAKKSWIAIVLKDEEGTPQGGTRYRITLPDGTIAEGTLDAKGEARVEGFDPGNCKVTFPDLDQKTWKEK